MKYIVLKKNLFVTVNHNHMENGKTSRFEGYLLDKGIAREDFWGVVSVLQSGVMRSWSRYQKCERGFL